MKVGIPRGLMFYKYFPFWKTLLEDLGNQIVVSPRTSRRILEAGVDACVDDLCVAVKIFFGHVLALKGQVDCLMVPRLVSVEKNKHDTFTCPKLIALPDMASALPDLPEIMELVVDVQRRPLWFGVARFALNFTRNPLRIRRAYRRGCVAQESYEALLRKGWSPEEALERLEHGRLEESALQDAGADLCIAILSHPYLIYDEFLNQDLQGLLRGMGARVVTPPMLEADLIAREAARYEALSWSYEKDLVGAGSHFLKDPEVDGIVFLISFACGPDSIVTEIILREVREQSDNPLMTLVIDEHTGMAGLHTRVEAFVDMVRRRKLERGAAAGRATA
jgi:predicted nucleotide-binding protein (sugar kinase/HSP70/actin superfamily)